MDQSSAAPDTTDRTPMCKFVRVIEERPNGLVVFEFSVGWPDLSAELVMPRAAFDEFCAANQVQRIAD
jgi:phenol/toluene 2-monooxygenase (NADH) P0/A0